MKKKLLTTLLSILGCFTVWNAQAQCGATAVFADPLPIMICEGDTGVINLTAAGTCAGTYEFRILDGATVVQPWSTSAVFNASPSIETLYTMEARCSACPATVVADTFTVGVTTMPTITGPMVVCTGDDAQLIASGSNGTIEWWDAAAGGTQLSTTDTLNTGPLTSTTTFYAQASSTGSFGSGGSVLITECGTDGFPGSASADYIEISNLYSTPVNTAGWVVAISNSYSVLNNVNPVYWYLGASFAPCSIQSRTDVASAPNYWGNNMFWNPTATANSWAIIIDDVGNVVDFIAWGWTAAQLATFNVTINGFNVTLGSEWTGNGCPTNCGVGMAGGPYSYSRNGSSDSNTAGDFVCQPTSLNALNPGLSCGWSASASCPYPFTVQVDIAPTASNPAPINVECAADVPAPDVTVVDDELDDFTTVPTVTHMGDVSNGLTCPETITRTYRVSDSCTNYIDVTQTITIHDITPPVIDPAPAGVTVACVADVPTMVSLNWTDNCDGSGTLAGVEVSDGLTCPETLTRTWTYTDACGNTATETQTIIIHDQLAPVLDAAPANVNVQCYADVPAIVSLAWTDNCDGAGSVAGVEVSDGLSCPETRTRTWTYTDGCGNTATETQTIIIHDVTPPTASNLLPEQVTTLPAPDPSVVTDAADNCSVPVVAFVKDSSDGGFCPEIVTRTYSVTDDCGNQIFVTKDFTVGDPLPVASFVASETVLLNLETNVDFINTSTGPQPLTYAWDFDDGSAISNEENPSHVFPDEESEAYIVELIVYTPFGCTDTATVVIKVLEELIYYIPNSFTPDGDEHNQTWLPVFESGFDPSDYNLSIYNRWGQIIWESHDPYVGWDGTYGGKIVETGSYVWKIVYKIAEIDDREMITGHVNILR